MNKSKKEEKKIITNKKTNNNSKKTNSDNIKTNNNSKKTNSNNKKKKDTPIIKIDSKKEKIKKKIKIGNVFLVIILVLATCSLTYSIYKILNWGIDNKNTNDTIKDIGNPTKEIKDDENTQNLNPPEDEFDPYWDYIKISLIDVDFNDLVVKNPDTVGWINVGGTNINYPVVQASNNDYYLNHSFNETWNDAGWIFMDYRNDAINFNQNTIIYGHSRYDKSMFGSLRNITRNNWYNNTENHIIKFSTPTENTLWQVFSVYTIPEESYYITPSFNNDIDYQTWLDTMLSRSVFDFHTTVSSNSKTITLSSCFTSDGIRVVLHAKLIKISTR